MGCNARKHISEQGNEIKEDNIGCHSHERLIEICKPLADNYLLQSVTIRANLPEMEFNSIVVALVSFHSERTIIGIFLN